MMKKVCILFFALFSYFSFSQDLKKMADEIKDEALQLYRSEMASWYGTDVLKANYNMENISGYFSYIDNTVPKCIFFSKENKILATISFPTNFKPENAKLELKERNFTETEREYFDIRNAAMENMRKDTIFRYYKEANFNIVPLIYKNEKKAYFLSGTTQNNTILFGNDYVTYFDKNIKVKETKKMHNSLLSFNIWEKDGTTGLGGAHSHIIDEFQMITVTDICTLMIYQHLTKWKYYATVSKKYLSFWDCETEQLKILHANDKNFEELKKMMSKSN